jgi:hypothetical protein
MTELGKFALFFAAFLMGLALAAMLIAVIVRFAMYG